MPQQVARYINPVLKGLKRLGGSGQAAEVYSAVIKDMGLENSLLASEVLKSGRSKLENKIQWARLYLATTGFIDRSRRGVWTLTEKGRASPELSDEDIAALLVEVQRQGSQGDEPADSAANANEVDDSDEDASPEVLDYRARLLAIIRELPPRGFEQLCQRLLRESGFEEAVVTGRTGDGGIDGTGVLRINPFVAFKVLFQCKRYAGTVGSPEVRNFRGAMQGRADKGIILTTGTFTADAGKEAVRDGVPPIELVDGERLVALFENLELGLIARTTYDVDGGFFEQFRTVV